MVEKKITKKQEKKSKIKEEVKNPVQSVKAEISVEVKPVEKKAKMEKASTSAPTMNDRSSDRSIGKTVGVPTDLRKNNRSVGIEKAKKVKKTSKNANKDTGSVDYQIKNFSDKIASLAKHLREHIHDFDSRRGLLIMVGKRRRLLNYVKKSDPIKYAELIKTLKLKK